MGTCFLYRLKNPNIKPIEYEITTNPYKDYSKIVHQLSNITDNTNSNNTPSTKNMYLIQNMKTIIIKNDFYENNDVSMNKNIITNNSNFTYFLKNS